MGEAPSRREVLLAVALGSRRKHNERRLLPDRRTGSIDERFGSTFLTSGAPVLSGGRLGAVQWTGRKDRRFCRRRAAD